MLKEQRIAFDLAAIDQLQQLRPQLPFQCDCRIVLHPLPKRPQAVVGAPKRNRLLTKLKPNSDRIGRQRTLERDGAVEPGEKGLCLVRIEGGFLELDELIAAAFEYHPFEAVRRDADETLAFFALAIGKIVRHAPDNVVPFLIQVALCLEYGAPDQGIETAPHFGNASLEIERAEFDPELFDQELAEVGLHLVMARTASEMPQQFKRARIVRQGFPELSRSLQPTCPQDINLVDNE